jgi:hypothetical protein
VITLEEARAELFQDLTSVVGPWRGALGTAPPFQEDHGFVAEWSANLHEIPRLGSLICNAIDIKK